MVKNNITRFLESQHVEFSIFELPVEKLGAIETAQILNIPVEFIYKTIVIRREKTGKSILAVVPGNYEVDLKLLAEFVGEKKLLLPTEKQAEEITGLQSGGISPLALINKGFQVVIDGSATKLNQIHVSGGQRGLNIRLSVDDLIRLTKANVGLISKINSD